MQLKLFNIAKTQLKFLFIIVLIMIKPLFLSAENKNPDSLRFKMLLDSANKNKFKNFPLAISLIQEAEIVAKRIGDKKKLFTAYRRMGLIYEDNSRLKEASTEYTKALAISEHFLPSDQLDIFVDWAIINKKLGNYKISKDYYERTLVLAEKTNDIEMIEFAYNGIGNLLKVAGEYDQAVEYHLKSAEIAEKRDKKMGVVSSLVDISDTYLLSKNYQLALSNIEKAYRLALEVKDSSRTRKLLKISNVLNAYGKILNAQGAYQNSLKKHLEALENYTSISDNKHIAETLIFIADTYAEMKQYDLAEEHFLKCFKYKEYLEFYEHPNFYLKLGKLYQKKNQNDKAIESLENSISLASKKDFKDILQKANIALAESYNIKGEHKKAYQSLQKANILGDSLFTEIKSKRLAEAQFKFDVEKAEAQIKFNSEKGEKEIQALKAKQNFYWLIMAAVVLLLITGVFVYVIKLKNKNTFILLQKSQEIQIQNARLEKSNEILRQFAYASAHDLKEPLRSISSFVHIIHRRYMKILPPEAEEYMNFVVSGVKRMEQLLSALLEYSTVASDDQVVTNATLLTHVIGEVKENLHTIMKEKNAIVTTEGYLPTVWITQLHLTQLFQNLISNSLKFSTLPPVIKVSGEVVENQLIINIQDNGIGMKKEYSDKIFRLFQRLSRSAQYEGTGIGLAICKHIVDKYNGNIWFDSVEGEGTTFHISFPISILKQEVDTEGPVDPKREHQFSKSH
jgi:signal transduction histidine kinase